MYDIDIPMLEQLVAFKKYGTLSEAAEHVYLTQPSLSRSMKKLEDAVGVELFRHEKNKLTLNEAGEIAAECAERILSDRDEMVGRIRAYDRSLHTLAIGSCAPGPLMVLLPHATAAFSRMTVTSETVADDGKLLEGLRENRWQIAILSEPVDAEDIWCKKYITEHLCLAVNLMHPAASFKEISFADMDGQTFVMYNDVGVWDSLVREKMPRAKFLMQSDIEAVGIIAGASDLPSFSTDVTRRILPSRQDMAAVPFSDPEATKTFWIACRDGDAKKYDPLFRQRV